MFMLVGTPCEIGAKIATVSWGDPATDGSESHPYLKKIRLLPGPV
jgi:hypothetical protein